MDMLLGLDMLKRHQVGKRPACVLSWPFVHHVAIASSHLVVYTRKLRSTIFQIWKGP